MKIKKRNYPNPVLAEYNDDVKGTFQAEYNLITSKEKYSVSINIRCDNESLLSLIRDGKCAYVINIECAYTRYRKTFKSINNEFLIDIKAEDIEGKVEISTFITAVEDINEYSNNSFHQDYEGISFKVKKGQILAVENGASFYAEKEKDNLQKFESIFTIQVDTQMEGYSFDLDSSNHRIIIKLTQKNYEIYTIFEKDQEKQSMIIFQIILPALIQILNDIVSELINEINELSQYRWYGVIEKRLNLLGIEIDNLGIEDIIPVAQKLIGDPIYKSLKSMIDCELESEDE